MLLNGFSKGCTGFSCHVVSAATGTVSAGVGTSEMSSKIRGSCVEPPYVLCSASFWKSEILRSLSPEGSSTLRRRSFNRTLPAASARCPKALRTRQLPRPVREVSPNRGRQGRSGNEIAGITASLLHCGWQRQHRVWALSKRHSCVWTRA